MSNTTPPLTLEEVAQTPDDAWLNHGFSAVVTSIEEKKTGPNSRTPNKKFWVIKLGSQTGPETAEWSLFTAPKFSEGALIDVTGAGIKRKTDTYNGGIKIQAGDKAIVTVVGQSAHQEEQQQRKAAGEPSVSGQPQHIQGQTVGMAMKEALALRTRFAKDSMELAGWFTQPEFWAAVHETASDIIRVSLLMEKGKLAPSPKERAGAPDSPAPAAAARPAAPGGGRSDPPKGAAKPRPGPGGNVAQDDDESETIPF